MLMHRCLDCMGCAGSQGRRPSRACMPPCPHMVRPPSSSCIPMPHPHLHPLYPWCCMLLHLRYFCSSKSLAVTVQQGRCRSHLALRPAVGEFGYHPRTAVHGGTLPTRASHVHHENGHHAVPPAFSRGRPGFILSTGSCCPGGCCPHTNGAVCCGSSCCTPGKACVGGQCVNAPINVSRTHRVMIAGNADR